MPVVSQLLETFCKRVFWNTPQELHYILFGWCQCRQIRFLSVPFQVAGRARSHIEQCQGSRVVCEPQECHDLPRKPQPSELCAQVHCCDAEPTSEIPISLASCNKQ